MSQRASIELETDRREPHPSTLGKLAIALGVELLKLLEDLSSADVISNALSKHLSSGYHNPVATPGISRQLKASYPEKIQLIAGCSEVEPSTHGLVNACAAFPSEAHAAHRYAWVNNSAICCRRAQWQPTALYGEGRDVPENH
jgi:transcriptional regulator with XRE-family HTH domain